MKINEGSLTYRLLKFGKSEWWMHDLMYGEVDTCGLSKALICSFFKLIVGVFVGLVATLLISLILGDFLGWLSFLIVNGWVSPNDTTIGLLSFIAVLS